MGRGDSPPTSPCPRTVKESAVRPVSEVAKGGEGGQAAAGPRAVGVESRDSPPPHCGHPKGAALAPGPGLGRRGMGFYYEEPRSPFTLPAVRHPLGY